MFAPLCDLNSLWRNVNEESELENVDEINQAAKHTDESNSIQETRKKHIYFFFNLIKNSLVHSRIEPNTEYLQNISKRQERKGMIL